MGQLKLASFRTDWTKFEVWLFFFFVPVPSLSLPVLACPAALNTTLKRRKYSRYGAMQATQQQGGKLKEKGRTCAWTELILCKVWQTETPDPDVLSAALAVNIWPHLSCHPGWHLGWPVCPQQQMWQTLLLMVQLLGLVPGAAARALLLLCWVLPYILKALLNRSVGIQWKEQSKMGTRLCLWNATPYVAGQLPSGRAASSRFVWVTRSLIHCSAVECKWENLSPFLLPCGDAPDRSQGSACTKPFVTPSSTHFPCLSLID